MIGGRFLSRPVARGGVGGAMHPPPNLPIGPLWATKWVKNEVFVGGLRGGWGSKSPLFGGPAPPQIDPGYGPVLKYRDGSWGKQFHQSSTVWISIQHSSRFWLGWFYDWWQILNVYFSLKFLANMFLWNEKIQMEYQHISERVLCHAIRSDWHLRQNWVCIDIKILMKMHNSSYSSSLNSK